MHESVCVQRPLKAARVSRRENVVSPSLCLTEGKMYLMQQICQRFPPRMEWMDE